MHVGAAMFFTDYSMTPAELATALEERGFESVWAPEHSHIPLTRKSEWPGGGELPKKYYDAMDPFVTLTAAAAARPFRLARQRYVRVLGRPHRFEAAFLQRRGEFRRRHGVVGEKHRRAEFHDVGASWIPSASLRLNILARNNRPRPAARGPGRGAG